MYSAKLFVIFYLLQLHKIEAQTKTQASCDESYCHCEVNKSNNKFEILCEGEGTKKTDISDATLKSSAKLPGMDLYVKISNFETVHINQSFMKEWINHMNPSLDIESNNEVIFEHNKSCMSLEGIVQMQGFAEIGIRKSHLDELPMGLLHGKSDVGLTLDEASVENFDMSSLLSDSNTLRCLKISNSSIGILGRSSSGKIKFQSIGSSSIKIYNSTIGAIKSGALNILKSNKNASLEIYDTSIGFVQRNSIRLAGSNILFEMINSSIGVLSMDAISNDNSKLIVINNTIGTEENGLISLKCNERSRNSISGNILIPIGHPHRCIQKGRYNMSKSGQIRSNLSKFISESCKKNVIAVIQDPNYIESDPLPPLKETDTTKQNHLVLPLAALSICLFLLVVILLIHCVWMKHRSRTKTASREKNLSISNHYSENVPSAPTIGASMDELYLSTLQRKPVKRNPLGGAACQSQPEPPPPIAEYKCDSVCDDIYVYHDPIKNQIKAKGAMYFK